MKKTLGLLAIVAVWQIAALLINKKILPVPVDVFVSFINNPWQIAQHSLFSIYRLTAGVALAIAVGLPCGLLIGYFKKADRLFSPILYVIAPIPKIALLPLIMLFFGIKDMSKIFLIFIIVVFQVIVAARDSVTKIPPEYFMPYNAAKAKNSYIFRNIIFPSSLPHLFTAIRVGLATSISVLFFAEGFGTKWGLGFYIMDMWMQLNYKQMYLGIITLGIIGLLSAIFVDRLEKRACPWL